MTQLQIDYWKLVEQQRHNAAEEGETKRHNVQGEGETVRHNTATEYIDALNARSKAQEVATKEREVATKEYLAPSQATANYASAGASNAKAIESKAKANESEKKARVYGYEGDKAEITLGYADAQAKMDLINSGVSSLGTLGGTVAKIYSAFATKGASTAIESLSKTITDGEGKVVSQVTQTKSTRR